MRARIAIGLLLAILAPACAGGPWMPRSRLAGWHAVQAGGTRLIGDLAPEELETLAGDLARFDAVFARLSGWPEGAGANPLAVYLFRSREVAERFGLGRGVGGWALTALDESFITVLVSSAGDQDRSLLFHEYTHILLARSRRAPLPAWYNEGLASYFSTVNWRDDAVVVGSAPGTAAARVMGRGAVALERLFAASTADMNYDEVADFYATSWALSHYLLSTPSGRRELSAFVKQLARGIPSQQAQTAAFGRSVDQIGAELAVHVAHLARGVAVETLLDASAFPVVDPPPAVALTPGEVAFALGALALAVVEVSDREDRGRWPGVAHSFLAMALPADTAAAPGVEAALGEARAESGDAEGAYADVQGALASAPDDARIRLRAARVALLRAVEQDASASAPALAEAEVLYRNALTLDPGSASAWFGLGQTLVRMARPDHAFEAFQAAKRLGWSAPLDIALARLHLQRGERERVADLLRPIAQDPHGSSTKREAAELLKEALP